MTPPDGAALLSFVRRMEREAASADALARTLERGESWRAMACEEGRAEGIREVCFRLKTLCGMGKLE